MDVMFGKFRDQPLSSPQEEDIPAFETRRVAPKSPGEAIKPVVPPPPPLRSAPRRSGFLARLSGLFTFIVVCTLALWMAFLMLERQAAQPGPLAEDKVLLVPRNSGVSDIATLLGREGIIAHPLMFEIVSLMNHQRGALKAGEFVFRARASIEEVIDTLVQGKAILHNLTIPEGLTSEQILARLKDNDILSGDVVDIPKDGTLLPDTYKFERGMTRQQLVGVMQSAQRQALRQIWERKATDLPVKTPQELVILASIVEKETGRADERPRVAGVFINRLNRRMRLQSDPTIVYGLVGGKGTLGRGILREEITRHTPYNTYVIDGLPPGPIANPGRAAMEAVANPSRTSDLFFVADGTGGHTFAPTYEQHQRNVSRWRQIERSREIGVDRAEPAPPEQRGEGSPALPGGASAFTGNMPDATQETSPMRPATTGAGRPRGFDAVEGTARDPLRNRQFDLNAPKTIPSLRP
jgi:UPF0755 protein